MIQYIQHHVVYENPLPQLRSRHGYFPAVAQLPSGELLAMIAIGEAFESVDLTTYVYRSADRGLTWELQGPLYDKSVDAYPTSDCLKPLVLRNGTLVALGYRFDRQDPELPIAIPNTEGILPGDDIVSYSTDDGRTWTVPKVIPRSTIELIEIPHNPIQLQSGNLVASGGLFKTPEGQFPSGQFGVLLRSQDDGKTWDDRVCFFEMAQRSVSAYESNICEMQPGRLVTLCWAHDAMAGQDYPNQVTVSHDDGHTWSNPIDTGHVAQSPYLIYLGGERLLTIHSHRGQDPGLFVRVVDFSNDNWNVLAERNIWGAFLGQQIKTQQRFHEMMKRIRFGNPSLLQLDNGEILAFHWAVDDGQGKILSHRLRIGE